MTTKLPSAGDVIRVTGILPFGPSKPGAPDPDPLPIGATGTVTNVVNAFRDDDRAQLWITWHAPNETRTLMLMGSDPYEVLDRYGLTDDTTLCPRCQSRTDWEDVPDLPNDTQVHTCLHSQCGYVFVGFFDPEDFDADGNFIG